MSEAVVPEAAISRSRGAQAATWCADDPGHDRAVEPDRCRSQQLAR